LSRHLANVPKRHCYRRPNWRPRTSLSKAGFPFNATTDLYINNMRNVHNAHNATDETDATTTMRQAHAPFTLRRL